MARSAVSIPKPQRPAETKCGRFNPQALKDRPGGTTGRLNPQDLTPVRASGLELHVLDEELGGVDLVVCQCHRHGSRHVELPRAIPIRGRKQ